MMYSNTSTSRPCWFTWMVCQNGVILVTGPDPILHVGDTFSPKPPAFVAHLEVGERCSKQKALKSPPAPREYPNPARQIFRLSPPYPVLCLSLPSALVFSWSSSSRRKWWAYPTMFPLQARGDIMQPHRYQGTNLALNYDHSCSTHLQAVISIHHPAVSACGQEEEES